MWDESGKVPDAERYSAVKSGMSALEFVALVSILRDLIAS